ncbi:MAG: molybdopterin dehydrogenase [Anaerolineaceae bacterium]|jgi:carbon-monoxide dehydrogenase medium subunit|nr:xanthine dehydrogenase family protein subunit M [Anaerolineae bacterium]MCL4823473.1 FAD binding domain-containing protein [Anaerolineales bacterium]MDL1925711.1 xanthine dehydrogenase family protein subunit M [Anaerolineae bacterium AMX1]GER80298.1 xanthine dehydrogenase subunit XdhB [Candidatus Denitrolinea symbiosum]GIK09530.1 MAG: molybdopterin dehydrogenase [Chloroflexota bacterium]GJQ38631.1 MAG: molybdopterin dehydrogenase [Anaerolineaceae bacterium]
MNLWQEYKRPASIAEAVQHLAAAPGPALPIAGGTDLLLDLRQGNHPPVHTLVDLTFVPEMTALELRADSLYIGATVPVSRIARDPLAGAHAQALVEACNLIAGPQVRNTATLGGNVAHALPAADGTIALAALDAAAEVASAAGTRKMPFASLFLGPGKSAIDKSKEIIVGFHIPITNYQSSITASCFKRVMRPQGVALPILNCAVWLTRADDAIADIRIAVGPGGPVPFRAAEAESALRGQPPAEEAFSRALDALLDQAKFRTSARRASADYRRHIVGGLFKDVLETAWKRAE